MQLSIYDFLYQKYKINKPIRLYQFFAGYGSQKLSFNYAGIPCEDFKIAEFAINSIQAYKDVHYHDIPDFKCPYDKEYLVNYFSKLGISADYNNLLTKQQLQKYSYEKLCKIWSNIQITHNLVNVCNIKGDDLEIDKNYCNILFYSFPCQDLSLAGDKKGMAKGSGTRSGLLWEVERILK